MEKLVLKKATKVLKPIKGFFYGPTGSGKTYSSLLIANGFIQKLRNCTEEEAWQHILLLDTEQGRGALYAGLGEYNHHSITPPFDTVKLIDLLNQVNLMDEIDVVIIDSLTHFWSKKGGILEQKTIADTKPNANTFTSWNLFGAKFNEMIDNILLSPKHIFITARAKSDTVLSLDDKGKMVPRTYGLKPDLREGFEYECDFTFNIDKETHEILVEKNFPGMATTFPVATIETGVHLYNLWTEKAIVKERTYDEIAQSIRTLSQTHSLIQFVQLALSGRKLEPDSFPLEQLQKLEKDLIVEVRKKQAKH